MKRPWPKDHYPPWNSQIIPENRLNPKRKGSYSNHPFPAAKNVSFREGNHYMSSGNKTHIGFKPFHENPAWLRFLGILKFQEPDYYHPSKKWGGRILYPPVNSKQARFWSLFTRFFFDINTYEEFFQMVNVHILKVKVVKFLWIFAVILLMEQIRTVPPVIY